MVTGAHDEAQTVVFRVATGFCGAVLGCRTRAGELPQASGSARGFLPGHDRPPRHRDVGTGREPCGPGPCGGPADGKPEPRCELAARSPRALLPRDAPLPGGAADHGAGRATRGGAGTAGSRAASAPGRPRELPGGAIAARRAAAAALRRRGRRSSGRAPRRAVPRRDGVRAGRPQPPRDAGQGDRLAAGAGQDCAPRSLCPARGT